MTVELINEQVVKITDALRTAFAEKLLMIASRAFNKSTYCIKTYIEKDNDSNLWHKVWLIDIR